MDVIKCIKINLSWWIWYWPMDYMGKSILPHHRGHCFLLRMAKRSTLFQSILFRVFSYNVLLSYLVFILVRWPVLRHGSIFVNFLNHDLGYKTECIIYENIVRVKIKIKQHKNIQNKKNTIKIMNVKISIKNKSKGNNKILNSRVNWKE